MEELDKSSTNFSEQRVKVLKTLGNIIKNLQEQQPTTTIKNRDLPLFYIDPKIILDYLTGKQEQRDQEGEIPDRILSEATIAIDYLEEQPIANGLPFWEKLDCEPMDYYKLFKIYRGQKEEIKEKEESKEKEEEDEAGEPRLRTHRSFENLKERTGIMEGALHSLSNIYHWIPRCKAYDAFKENVVELEKAKIVKQMEGNHIRAAKTIFDQCMTYLTDISENGWYDLKGNLQVSPKEMLGWLDLSVRLERLSLGLSPDKNEDVKEKITKIVNTVKLNQDNRTINLNQPKNAELNSNKYLQEMVDILQNSNALPKEIVAKGDVQSELRIIEEVISD